MSLPRSFSGEPALGAATAEMKALDFPSRSTR
jgi:hypothetical protein